MSAGGITYGVAKPILATVVENGVGEDDPRVIVRTNEAIHAILDEVTPVGGMITADVQASGTDGDELFLPKEMENIIDAEVLDADVNGQRDISWGGYNIVNNFAYVDPNAATDIPLIDLFLQPDPDDPTILRRKYRIDGLTPNATVRATGAKRFVPITSDNDYLIVQNILAIKDMIQSIERRENNDPQGAELYHKACIERLAAEVKKHQLDPRNSMRRKAEYDADMANYASGTFGWTRARLAFELPNGLTMGKSELTRIVEQAEMACISAGQYLGTLEEYTAEVTDPDLLAPKEVDTIVAISLCGEALDIKSMFFRYIQHGKWWGCGWCCPELRDEGEIYNRVTGERRRSYKLSGLGDTPQTIRFVGALRWVKKDPEDPMVIKNLEAMRLMCSWVMTKDQNDRMSAIRELDTELNRYMSGQIVVPPVSFNFGFRRVGVL